MLLDIGLIWFYIAKLYIYFLNLIKNKPKQRPEINKKQSNKVSYTLKYVYVNLRINSLLASNLYITNLQDSTYLSTSNI